jgi:hypothetical protein
MTHCLLNTFKYAALYIFVLDYEIHVKLCMYMKVLLHINEGRQNQNMRPKTYKKCVQNLNSNYMHQHTCRSVISIIHLKIKLTVLFVGRHIKLG